LAEPDFPFIFVSTDSKELNNPCKPFRISTYERLGYIDSKGVAALEILRYKRVSDVFPCIDSKELREWNPKNPPKMKKRQRPAALWIRTIS
jgi:hypothetical protein